MTHPITVLCIDDEADMVQLIQRMVEERGFVVRGSTNAEEGLALAQGGGIDLVLLDLMMPLRDGWDVFRRLRADERTENIPIIVVSARSRAFDRAPATDGTKVDAYVTKPFGPRELLQAIDEVLSRPKGLVGQE